MKALLLALMLSLSVTAQQSSTPKWIEDFSNSDEKSNAAHWWISCAGTIAIGETIYYFTDNKPLSTIAGGLIMFGAGWLKEDIWDGRMGRGVKSGGDKFMNGMGCTGGMMGHRVIIDVREKKLKRDYWDDQIVYRE